MAAGVISINSTSSTIYSHKLLSRKCVLGMTLHRKSLQPVRSSTPPFLYHQQQQIIESMD